VIVRSRVARVPTAGSTERFFFSLLMSFNPFLSGRVTLSLSMQQGVPAL